MESIMSDSDVESRGLGEHDSNSTLSQEELTEEENYRNQVFYLSIIKDLSLKIQRECSNRNNDAQLLHSINKYASGIIDANEELLHSAQLGCLLRESEKHTVGEVAKAAAQEWINAFVGPADVDSCEGGGRRVTALTNNTNGVDLIMSSQSAASNAASSATSSSSLGFEQGEQEEENNKPRKRRRAIKSSSVPSDTSLPFDEAKLKEAAAAEINELVGTFDSLNCDCDEDEAQPLAIETSIVTVCRLKLHEEFSSRQLSAANVHNILECFRGVMKGADIFREELVSIEQKTIAILQSVPKCSDASQSRGDFLSSLSSAGNVDYTLAMSEAGKRIPSVLAINAALGKDKRGNDRSLNASILREYSVASNPVRNLLQILVNISSAIDVLSNFSVIEVFSRSEESKRLATELYRELFSSDLDETNFSALQLLVEVVVPILRKNVTKDNIRALKLAMAICEQSLNTNYGRMNLVYRKFRDAASKSMESSGEIVQSTTDYFSCPTRRKDAMIAFHGLVLADAIDAKTPDHIIQKHGGFAIRALGLSWKNLIAYCRRIVSPNFFGTNSETSFNSSCTEDDLELLKKSVTWEKKTKVVIYNHEQMKSLKALAQFKT